MEQVETSKLNRQISGILERVAQGEVFALTRYGKVVAHLVPADYNVMGPAGDPGPIETEPAIQGGFPLPRNPDEKPKSWAQRHPEQAAKDELLKRLKK